MARSLSARSCLTSPWWWIGLLTVALAILNFEVHGDDNNATVSTGFVNNSLAAVTKVLFDRSVSKNSNSSIPSVDTHGDVNSTESHQISSNATLDDGPTIATIVDKQVSLDRLIQANFSHSLTSNQSTQISDNFNTTELPLFVRSNFTIQNAANVLATFKPINESQLHLDSSNGHMENAHNPISIQEPQTKMSNSSTSHQETQIRGSTTIFVDGEMLNASGVPIVTNQTEVFVNSTTNAPELGQTPKSQHDFSYFRVSNVTTGTHEQQTMLPTTTSTTSVSNQNYLNQTSRPSMANLVTTTPAPQIPSTSVNPKGFGPTQNSVQNNSQHFTPASSRTVSLSLPKRSENYESNLSPLPKPKAALKPSTTPATTVKASNSTRRFQLIEVRPGIQLLESHPDSVSKTLRIANLFNEPGNSVDLSLARLEDAQWHTDFFQLSHYLITNTDKLGFFKVSLQEIFSKHVHGLPNVNYHRLMTNHTNLYASYSNGTLNTSAVLLISRLESYVEIYGLINDHLMITPVWRHSTTVVHNDGYGTLGTGYVKRGEKLNQFYTDPTNGALLHALIDLNGDSIGRHMGFDVNMLLHQIRAQLSLAKKATRGVSFQPMGPPGPDPNTIYPEVSLLLDHWAYQNHGRNVDELWRYMVIYFTRIDLIFRQLTSPLIRLRLRDIFIATRPFLFQKVEPKLKFKKPQESSTRTYLNSMKAINELGVYFYTESKTFANADLMLVITGQDLCGDSSDSGWASANSRYDSCSYATVKGQSFVGGACRADLHRHKKLNVAIVEDSGYFDGILVAAHELGHLMGSVHDGQWPISGILGPGGRGCMATKGYLMSDTGTSGFVPSYNQFRWSVCTAEQFKYFSYLPRAVCLYNRPSF